MLRKTLPGNVYVPLTLICIAVLTMPAFAQHFQPVKGTLTQIAAGRNEVFGVDAASNIWRLSPAQKGFVQIQGFLVQVAVGGGTVAQTDDVWGVNGSGGVFRFDYSTKLFNETGGVSLTSIAVGVGTQDKCHPYEVWGIYAPNQRVYRYDYCLKAFAQVPAALTQVATGGGDVWGLNGSSQIFHYDFATELFVLVPGVLTQISVGVNDVWGVNGKAQIYRYDPNSVTFQQVTGVATQVWAGGDGVWALNGADGIFRFDSSSASLVQVPGFLANIAPGSGAGVWGINASNAVFTFIRP